MLFCYSLASCRDVARTPEDPSSQAADSQLREASDVVKPILRLVSGPGSRSSSKFLGVTHVKATGSRSNTKWEIFESEWDAGVVFRKQNVHSLHLLEALLVLE